MASGTQAPTARAGAPARTTPKWVKDALSVPTIIGAVLAGVAMWLPTHSIGECVKTGLLMVVFMGGLRALDGPLTPMWNLIASVPRGTTAKDRNWRGAFKLARWAAGIGIPIWFAISKFQPSASGHEVSAFRTALIGSSLIAFVCLRPRKART